MNNNEQTRPLFRGELALAIAVALNSFGVVLMLYSGSGISAISSVPYAFSEVFPFLSLGTWTYLFQGGLVLTLMILRRRFVVSYLFSFVVGFAFSQLLDVHEGWIDVLPTSLGWCVAYFTGSYLLLCFGIALSNRCKLPIVPTDLFPPNPQSGKRQRNAIATIDLRKTTDRKHSGIPGDNRNNRNQQSAKGSKAQ